MPANEMFFGIALHRATRYCEMAGTVQPADADQAYEAIVMPTRHDKSGTEHDVLVLLQNKIIDRIKADDTFAQNYDVPISALDGVGFNWLSIIQWLETNIQQILADLNVVLNTIGPN